MAKNIEAQRAKLAKGEQLDAGFCFDPGRNPDIFECHEEDTAVAAGDVSVSWDGRTVTNLKTGEVETREMPDRFRVAQPVTLAEATEASGGAVASAGADTATTDGATGTGGGGGTRSRAR